MLPWLVRQYDSCICSWNEDISRDSMRPASPLTLTASRLLAPRKHARFGCLTGRTTHGGLAESSKQGRSDAGSEEREALQRQPSAPAYQDNGVETYRRGCSNVHAFTHLTPHNLPPIHHHPRPPPPIPHPQSILQPPSMLRRQYGIPRCCPWRLRPLDGPYLRGTPLSPTIANFAKEETRNV